MTHNADKATLDWRDLVPPQECHSCDCNHCDMDGELEPIQWPMLVTFAVDGVDYVTDRYMAIRADLAPVPAGYEGNVQAASAPPGFPHALVTERPATGVHFRWQTLKAIEATGWRLRALDHPDNASENAARMYGVATAGGDLIGLAVASKHVNDDVWSSTFTREYVEPEEADRG